MILQSLRRLPLGRAFSKASVSEIQSLDLELTAQNRARLLFNTKLPEGSPVLTAEVNNYSVAPVSALSFGALSYLVWGVSFGITTYTEILLSAGVAVGGLLSIKRELFFNKSKKVFAIVKQPSGSYKIGYLEKSLKEPKFIEAKREEIKVNGGRLEDTLGVPLQVGEQNLVIPAGFKVDHRLWK
jgi:hypothetical protein